MRQIIKQKSAILIFLFVIFSVLPFFGIARHFQPPLPGSLPQETGFQQEDIEEATEPEMATPAFFEDQNQLFEDQEELKEKIKDHLPFKPKGRGPDQNEEEEEEEEEETDIVREMPQGEFLTLKDGEKIQGKIKIQFQIEGVEKIEFYLRRPESLVETYLGRASQKEDNLWEFEWDTSNTPNGRYFLIPKILSEYGDYNGKTILVRVKNMPKRDEKKIHEVAKEVEEEAREIQEEEERVREDIEETAREVEEVMEETTQRMHRVIEESVKEEETKEELQEQIEEKKEEIKRKIQDKLKKLVEEKEEKKKEEIKEEIIRTGKKVMEPVAQAIKPEEKPEIAQLDLEIRQMLQKAIEKAEKLAEKKRLIETKKEEIFAQDRDNDNLPDLEELRLGTDPLNPDTDNDGFLDGVEVKLGFNPKKPSPADKIKYQEPIRVQAKISKHLKVEKVEITQKEEKKVLAIYGKALPNSFVTIYIYSLPIIVVAKADSNGNWEYILDKPLTDGQHKIYVAITNNKGEIEETSEPFVFAKTGDKIIRLFETGQEDILAPAQLLQRSFTVLVIGIVFFALGLAFAIIGFIIRSKKFPQ